MDSQAYIIKITVDYNMHVAKNFGPTGKVQILIGTEIRILPVSTSAHPHFTPGRYARPDFFANARDRTVFYTCVSYASADQWHDCNSSRGIIMVKTHRLFDELLCQITTTKILNC